MKKIVLLLVMLAMLPAMRAQSYDTVSGPDGKLPGYHYSWWYDTTFFYLDLTNPHYSHDLNLTMCHNALASDHLIRYAKMEYVNHPAAITGIGVWVLDSTLADIDLSFPVQNPSRPLPEYIDIFQYDRGKDSAILVARVQWDTATPKVMKVPLHSDTALYGFEYCYLYEVNLPTPVRVDSSFYLVGTKNNNETNEDGYFYYPTIYAHAALGYISFPDRFTEQKNAIIHPQNFAQDTVWCFAHDAGEADSCDWFSWAQAIWGTPEAYGMYMPKIDYAEVRVTSNNDNLGTAGPSGQLSKWVEQTFYATPFGNNVFTHWEDGSTENPRTVYITQDTVLKAFFNTPCEMNARSSNDELGYVVGSRTYFVGDTAFIEAVPTNGDVQFAWWNDYVTDNPRRVVMTQDTTFTAYFAHPAGIDAAGESAFSLSPNPTEGNVTITLATPATADVKMTLHDVAGHEVMTVSIAAGQESAILSLHNLPAGAYYATLHQNGKLSTQKLVLK